MDRHVRAVDPCHGGAEKLRGVDRPPVELARATEVEEVRADLLESSGLRHDELGLVGLDTRREPLGQWAAAYARQPDDIKTILTFPDE